MKILLVSIITTIALVIGAHAELVTGATANGCSYEVINGEYMYKCPSKVSTETPAKTPAATAATAAATTPSATSQTAASQANTQTATPAVTPKAESAPVTDYSQVKFSGNTSPSMEDHQTFTAPTDQSKKFESTNAIEEDAPKANDGLYGKLFIGSSAVTQANSSTTTLGFGIGTDIDEQFGFDLSYAYGKQSMLLGLASRSNNNSYANLKSDSSLRTHLVSGEVNYFFNERSSRLRPYLSGGLSWRSAVIKEEVNTSNSRLGSRAELSQQGWGPILGAGVRLEIKDNLRLFGAFRYYLPLTNNDSTISTTSSTALRAEDDNLTSSSQYQFVIGTQILF